MTGIVVRTRRQEGQQRRRILAVVGGATFIAGFFAGFVSGTISAGLLRRPAATPPARESTATPREATAGSPPAAPPGTATPSASAAATPPADAPVLAWQPSHEDERRSDGYHEFRAMGAVAAMASREVRTLRTVTAWEIDSGLYGSNALAAPSNTGAFDKELAVANDAGATYFVGLQTDAADKPGVIVYYQEDDDAGAQLARELSGTLAGALGVEDLGRLGVRFYSLDPTRNKAPYRVIMEFRETTGRLARFDDKDEQARVAKALARAVEAAARSRTPRSLPPG